MGESGVKWRFFFNFTLDLIFKANGTIYRRIHMQA